MTYSRTIILERLCIESIAYFVMHLKLTATHTVTPPTHPPTYKLTFTCIHNPPSDLNGREGEAHTGIIQSK